MFLGACVGSKLERKKCRFFSCKVAGHEDEQQLVRETVAAGLGLTLDV